MRRRQRALVVLAVVLGVLAPAAAALAQAGEAISGTMQTADGEPIPGIVLQVETDDGEPVGEATTDDDGDWLIELPGSGAYVVIIDPGSIPEDRELRNPDHAEPREVTVQTGQQRTILYPFGESQRAVTGFWARFLSLFVDGIRFGLIIGMTAIGLSLIFGTTGLVNFSHGEFVAFGAIIAWFLQAGLIGGWRMPLILATLFAVGAGALLGGAVEKGVFGPLRSRGSGLIAMLVVSIGLSLFIRHLLLYFFGGRALSYSDFAVQSRVTFGPIAATPKSFWIIGLSILVLVGVGLLLQKTKLGKAMRAVADNRDLAESSGINVKQVILVIWMLGGALAALGGVFQGIDQAVSWNMGFLLLLLMFAGVILGGIGTAYGALVGSLLVGVLVQTSTLFVAAELKNTFALGILILVLLLRPQGILGRAERIG